MAALELKNIVKRYQGEARASLERQLTAMLALFDAKVRICWASDEDDRPALLEAAPGVLAISAK